MKMKYDFIIHYSFCSDELLCVSAYSEIEAYKKCDFIIAKENNFEPINYNLELIGVC